MKQIKWKIEVQISKLLTIRTESGNTENNKYCIMPKSMNTAIRKRNENLMEWNGIYKKKEEDKVLKIKGPLIYSGKWNA